MKRDPELAAYERRRIATLPTPWWVDLCVMLERMVIRLGRLCLGALVVAAGLWLITTSYDTLSQPFASMSPLGLLGGIVAGLIGIALAIWALSVAFGEGAESRFEEYWRVSQANPRHLMGFDDE